MAIREKLKAKFGRKTTSGNSTPSTTDSGESYYTGRTDIEYYKPHEIPRSKYRCKVDPEHQESLDSYSFMDAFQTVRRKTSTAFSGTFSPGGTKAHSAAASRAPSIAQSRRTSWMSRSRRSSFSGVGTDGTDSPAMEGIPSRRNNVGVLRPTTHESNISEKSENDADTANDLSRINTVKDTTTQSNTIPQIILQREATTINTNTRRPQSPNDTPFTVEELERAMTRHTMRVGSAVAAY